MTECHKEAIFKAVENSKAVPLGLQLTALAFTPFEGNWRVTDCSNAVYLYWSNSYYDHSEK